jgi:hypothetical protein
LAELLRQHEHHEAKHENVSADPPGKQRLTSHRSNDEKHTKNNGCNAGESLNPFTFKVVPEADGGPNLQ